MLNIQTVTKCLFSDCVDSTGANVIFLYLSFFFLILDPDITNAEASEEKPDYVL